MSFAVGSRVEVIGRGLAFHNSFYAATLIEVDERKGWVEYEALVDDQGERVIEEVRLRRLRPFPPLVVIQLSVGDIVDVYDRGGWWRGTIVGETETQFHVFFDYMAVGLQHGVYDKVHTRIHQLWRCADPRSVWMFQKL